MIIQTLGAFFAVISFAILIEIPKKVVLYFYLHKIIINQ